MKNCGKNIKTAVFMAAIITYIVSAIIYYIEYQELQVGPRFFNHFYVLLIVSTFVSLILFLSESNSRILIFFIIRYSVFFLIGYPLGNRINIETVLFIGLIFEANFYPSDNWNSVILILINFLFVLTQGQGSAWSNLLEPVPLQNLLTAGFINIIVTITVWILRFVIEFNSRQKQDISYMNSAITQLSDINIGFQDFVKEQEFNILLEERKRVSREIHDTVGYALTNIIMMMEVLQVLGDKNTEKRSTVITGAKEQAQKGLDDTRAALRQLRKKEIPKKHGLNMISELVSSFRLASGIDITINYGNLPNYIDYKTDQVLFRFIQEGMTNVFRHGMATRVSVSFWETGGEIIATIEDNGLGAEEIVEGIGLSGMRERLEEMNGKLLFKNTDIGFMVEARIPLVPYKEGSNGKN